MLLNKSMQSPKRPLASTLRNKLSSMKLANDKNAREQIIEMRDIASQSKSLEVTFSESFLVQFVLDSSHAEYGPFKISYNTHKERWSINKLLTMCV